MGQLAELKDRPLAKMHLVGGDIFIDFLNTAGSRDPSGASMTNKLRDYADLVAWGLHADLLSVAEAKELLDNGRRQPKNAAAVVTRALRLREALYKLCRAMQTGGRESKSLHVLNAELDRCPARQQLVRRGNRLELARLAAPVELDRMLWPVTYSAAQWLTSGDPSVLRICAGTGCGWVFLDLSKNRSRRWCVMADCGNRAKVRRFREQLIS